MKFEYTATSNWSNAFRGLRHPLESYHKSDSYFGFGGLDIDFTKLWFNNEKFNHISKMDRTQIIRDWLNDNAILKAPQNSYIFIGPNDMDLAQRMIKAGTPNDKFLRQIFISVDITAPLYW